MKRRLVLACAIAALTAVARSEEFRSKPKFTGTWLVVSPQELPTGISLCDPEDPARPLEKINVCWFDFDRDGRVDLIVDLLRGGTGGHFINLYRNEPSGYREVLSTQSTIASLGITEDAPRIEVWSRAGGGEYRAATFQWEKGGFVEVYADWLQQEDDDRFRFVRRTFPKTSSKSPPPTPKD